MYDITALGELLVDFLPAGDSEKGNPLFEFSPGGAPCNLLAALSRLGGKGAFIGMVGKDSFGQLLKTALEKNGVATSGLRFTDKCPTTITFVTLSPTGERSFSFYRNPGADTLLSPEDIDFSLIDNCRIFHFGSVSMTHESSKSATLKAAEYAKNKGRIISFDPNWRPLLWKNKESALYAMKAGLEFADIVKVSEEELYLLTGEENVESGADKMLKSGVMLVLVTMGGNGSYYAYDGGKGYAAPYSVNTVDTTACGDSFFGALLFKLSGISSLDKIPQGEMEEYVRFANAAGAVTASRKGAMDSHPSLEEIKKLQSSSQQ